MEDTPMHNPPLHSLDISAQVATPSDAGDEPSVSNPLPAARRKLLGQCERFGALFGALGGALTAIGWVRWAQSVGFYGDVPESRIIMWLANLLAGAVVGLLFGIVFGFVAALILRSLLPRVLAGTLRPLQASAITATAVAALGVVLVVLPGWQDFGAVLRVAGLLILYAWGTCLWSCNRILQSTLHLSSPSTAG
jgi:hypothetical protein